MNIEDKVGEILCDNNITISTAESLTGGLLCGKLVNYPGISKVLIEGIISYSIESKIKILGVSKDTIRKYTDVSIETAKEMAIGVSKLSGSNIAIATTGNAGPSGDPVGLAFIGFYINGDVSCVQLNLIGDRQEIRNEVVDTALNTLYDKLKDYIKKVS